MSRRLPAISLYFVRAVLHNAVNRGLDPVELLRRNRISPRLLGEADAGVSIERFADLQTSTMIAMGDETLGYAPRIQPIGSWAMMCHAVINCSTLGQAMARFCRFYQLFDAVLRAELLVEDDQASVQMLVGEGELLPYAYEMTLFNAHRFASWLIGEYLPLTRVDFCHGMGARPTDYRHMFLAHPVAFDQPVAQLVFAPELLARPVVQDEQSLRRFLRHPVLALLTQSYDRNSWTAQVRELLARNLSDTPELGEVAQTLNVHPQTLRRRLSAEGTSFKDLKNLVRRDTALHYLGKHGLSIEEIAHRSGFSESSAFIRAFKGWTGITPYTYRKGL